MSIDASALTNIQNAINSSSPYSSRSTYDVTRQQQDEKLDTITSAAVDLATQSRYRTAFEDKLKAATGSEDEVTISEESIAALANYVKNGEESQATSQGTQYTYDYSSLRQQRQANLAAIEKEVAATYGKQAAAAETTDETVTREQAEQSAAENATPTRQDFVNKILNG